jgi:hypothetical protein
MVYGGFLTNRILQVSLVLFLITLNFMKNLLLLLSFLVAFLFSVNSQTLFYFQNFETNNDWTLSRENNGNTNNNNNYWLWGLGTDGATTGAATYQGANSLQVWRRVNPGWSADYNGQINQNRTAQRVFDFSPIPLGSDANFSFFLLCGGETSSNGLTFIDYFQVEINGTVVLGPLVNVTSWTLQTIDISSYIGNPSVIITFRWVNNASVANQPAARIDDVKIEYVEPSTLPIELVSFEAKPTIYNTVDLTWVTASELNNDFFTIERSIDGLNWEIVDTLSGAGTTNQENNYKLTDKRPHFGLSYYRLKQTDFDGTTEIFYPKSVFIETKEKMLINVVNILGQTVDINTPGLIILVFSNGETLKILNQ